MSVRKLTTGLLTVVVMLGGITKASAKDFEPVMVDPFQFEPDFLWFEPVTNMDLADMKPKKRAPNGWFATYDRLKLYGSQPETNNSQRLDTNLNSGGGHRYEIGYMLPDKDNGWSFNATNFGVSERDRLGPTLFPPQVTFFEGVPIEGLPHLTGTTSINIFEYDSFELNKTWRLEPYHYGGFLEPLIGIRYMKVYDRNQFDDYIPPPLGPPPIFADPDFGTVNSSVAETDNTMLGAQIGFRYFKFRDRFTFSTDFRVFGGGSWQSSRAQQTTKNLQLIQVPALTDTVDVIAPITLSQTTPIYSRNTESFVGFDVRTELGYQLTRHLSIRAGVQLIDIGTGVWRGGDGSVGLDAGNQNQDLLIVGYTFGINLNR